MRPPIFNSLSVYFLLISSSRRRNLSKSLMYNRSWMIRYFSNSDSACCLASSAVTRPASMRISRSISERKRFSLSSQSAIVIAELNWALAWYALMRVFWMELRFLYVFFVVSSWPPWEATDYFWSQCPELLAWLAFVAFTSSYMGWQGRL